MRAVVFENSLKYRTDYPEPEIDSGWARIKVSKAGICGTDLEITKGYMGFTGVLGHEFVGTVDICTHSEWMGKRVTGEINAGCGECEFCLEKLARHCPNRTVLGILNLDGCMADYCKLPVSNLIEIPEHVSDEQAVLIEPLAAACEILDQVSVSKSDRIFVLGDGRLGILCAWVLSTVSDDVTLIGHHSHKLERAQWRGLKTSGSVEELTPKADFVVEATGSGKGLSTALSLCRSRGTVILKSTVAEYDKMNLAEVVINEISVIGSRCGLFRHAVKLIKDFPDIPLDGLITAEFPVEEVDEAFSTAADRSSLKVILKM